MRARNVEPETTLADEHGYRGEICHTLAHMSVIGMAEIPRRLLRSFAVDVQ